MRLTASVVWTNYGKFVFAYLRPQVHRGDYKSLARPGRKQATETEDFDFHISYL